MISKGMVETGQKSPREIVRSVADAEWFANLGQSVLASAFVAFETELREDVDQAPPRCGRQTRIILASLLL